MKRAQLRRLLKEARKEAGLNQTQVAQRLGKNQTYVSKYELGERRLDVLELLDVLRVLNIDPIEFIRKIKEAGK